MLIAKLAWDKTTAFVLMNEILLTKLTYLTETYPQFMMRPEVQTIVTLLDSTYQNNLELLDFVTDKLQERDRSQALSDEQEHAVEIRDILNQIYTETDTDGN